MLLGTEILDVDTLAKSLGYSGSMHIIAIGPQGGKIVGYGAHGKPIYADSNAAQKLHQQAEEVVKHKSPAEHAAAVLSWLLHLGIDSSHGGLPGSGLVLVGPNNGQKLQDAFGAAPVAKAPKMWTYKAEDLLKYVGKPLVPAAPEKTAVQAALASGTFGADAPFSPEIIASLKTQGDLPGGSHGGKVVTDKEGKKYAFKAYQGQLWIALAEEAANRIAKLVSPSPEQFAKGELATHDGEKGVLLEWKTGTPLGNEESGVNGIAASTLQKHFVALVQHQVIDWLVGNHDTHGGNFLVDGELVNAIDKGHAWKFIAEDKLNATYKGSPNTPIYNALWKSFQAKKVTGDPVAAAQEVLKNVAKMSKEQFAQIVTPYFDALKKIHSPSEVAKRKEAALARFSGIVGDWQKFLGEMTGKTVKFNLGDQPAPTTTVQLTPAPAPQSDKELVEEFGKLVDEGKLPELEVKAPVSHLGVGAAVTSAADYDSLPVGTIVQSAASTAEKKFAFQKWPDGKWANVDPTDNGDETFTAKEMLHYADSAPDVVSVLPLPEKDGSAAKNILGAAPIGSILQASGSPAIAKVNPGVWSDGKDVFTDVDLAQLYGNPTGLSPEVMFVPGKATVSPKAVATVDPPKKVVQLPGWPQSKGHVTVHHPGGSPTAVKPGVKWPEGYPGPGYTAEFKNKKNKFKVLFGVEAGKFAADLFLPDGKIVTCSSPQDVADKVVCFTKGAPLDTDSTTIWKKWKCGYTVSTMLKLKDFNFVEAGSLPAEPTPTQQTVQELETAKLVTPEQILFPEKPAPTPDEILDQLGIPSVPKYEGPSWEGVPYGSGKVVTKKQKGLGEVKLTASASNFWLLMPGNDIWLPFATSAAAADHVWVNAKGYKDVATWKEQTGAKPYASVPSGAGYKFWGLKSEAEMPKPPGAGGGDGAPASPPGYSTGWQVGDTVLKIAQFDALPVGTVVGKNGDWKPPNGITFSPGSMAGFDPPMKVTALPSSAPIPAFGNDPMLTSTGWKEPDAIPNKTPPGPPAPTKLVGTEVAWKLWKGDVTAAELNALPEGTIVLAEDGDTGEIDTFKKLVTGHWGGPKANAMSPATLSKLSEGPGALKIKAQPGIPGWSGVHLPTQKELDQLPPGTVISNSLLGAFTKVGMAEWVPEQHFQSPFPGSAPATPWMMSVMPKPDIDAINDFLETSTKLKATKDKPAPVVPATPSISAPAPQKVVTTLESVPEKVQAVIKKIWEHPDFSSVVANGPNAGEWVNAKSPNWPEWVPPPGLPVELVVSGEKYWAVVTNSGYTTTLGAGGVGFAPSSMVKWVVLDGEGKQYTYSAGLNAKAGLMECMMEVPGQGAAILQAVNHFVQNAKFAINSTVDTSVLPPIASVAVSQGAADAQLNNGVIDTVDLAAMIQHENVIGKYGALSLSPSHYIGAPPGSVDIHCISNHGANPESGINALNDFLHDHGLLPLLWPDSVMMGMQGFHHGKATLTSAALKKKFTKEMTVGESLAAAPVAPPGEPAADQKKLEAQIDAALADGNAWLTTLLLEAKPEGSLIQTLVGLKCKTVNGWFPVEDGKLHTDGPATSDGQLATSLAALKVPVDWPSPDGVVITAPAATPLDYAALEAAPIGQVVVVSATGGKWTHLGEGEWKGPFGKLAPAWDLATMGPVAEWPPGKPDPAKLTGTLKLTGILAATTQLVEDDKPGNLKILGTAVPGDIIKLGNGTSWVKESGNTELWQTTTNPDVVTNSEALAGEGGVFHHFPAKNVFDIGKDLDPTNTNEFAQGSLLGGMYQAPIGAKIVLKGKGGVVLIEKKSAGLWEKQTIGGEKEVWSTKEAAQYAGGWLSIPGSSGALHHVLGEPAAPAPKVEAWSTSLGVSALQEKLKNALPGTKLVFPIGTGIFVKKDLIWESYLKDGTKSGLKFDDYDLVELFKPGVSAEVTLPGNAPEQPPTPPPPPPKLPPKPKKNPSAKQLKELKAKKAEAEAKLLKLKEYQQWVKTNPSVTDTETLSALAHFQKSLSGKKFFAQQTTNEHLLIGDGTPEFFDSMPKGTDMIPVGTPLGTMFQIPNSSFIQDFPDSWQTKGPDGKEYPVDTKFNWEEVPEQPKKDVLAKQPGFVKLDEHTHYTDKMVAKFKNGTSLEEISAACKAAGLEPFPVLNGGKMPLVGSLYTSVCVLKAEAEKPSATTKKLVVDIPPQPTFTPAAIPFTFGPQPQGAEAVSNSGDLDNLHAVKGKEWGHTVRIGKPGVFTDPFLKTKRVILDGKKEFFEVHGEFLDFDISKAKGMASLSGNHKFYATADLDQFKPESGVHAADSDDTISFAGFSGTTDSGTEFSVGGEDYLAHRNKFIVRVPVDADVRAELAKALTAMGKDPNIALADHDADAERMWLKAKIVRAGIGADGIWTKDASGLPLKRENYADEAWLDGQLKTLGMIKRVDSAKIVTGAGNVPRVILDDISDDDLTKAGVHYLYTGTDTAELVAHHLAQGEGVPSRAGGYWNGTQSASGAASSDDQTGGACGTMTRMVRGSSTVGRNGVGFSSEFHFVFHPRVLKRADYYTHNTDSYGATAPHQYGTYSPKSRKGVLGITGGSNEVLMEHGVDMKDVAGIRAESESGKEKLLKLLKEKNPELTQINGIPLAEFIFVPHASIGDEKDIKEKCKGLQSGVLP